MRHFCRFSNTMSQKSAAMSSTIVLHSGCHVYSVFEAKTDNHVYCQCVLPLIKPALVESAAAFRRAKRVLMKTPAHFVLLPGGISLLSIISVLYLSGSQNSRRASHSAWKALKKSHFTTILPFEFSLAKFNFFGIQFWTFMARKFWYLKKTSNFWTSKSLKSLKLQNSLKS